MSKRNSPPVNATPSIPKSEGKGRLLALLKRADTLLAGRPLKEGQEDIWATACLDVIEATFGRNNGHVNTFIGPVRIVPSDGTDCYDQYAERRDAERIQRRVEVLKSLVEQIDLEIGFEAPPAQPTFWDDIHPTIARVAKPRFEAGHYADCVEAALKEINSIVKEHFRRKTGKEEDGASLMLKAFSPNGPAIVLDDLSTESGRNIQQGYMQLFAGAMIGIRNPKAHANISITENRAKHFLYLASLLAHRFDERL
jgi:uncharacterized protein (TIGR02391 family)